MEKYLFLSIISFVFLDLIAFNLKAAPFHHHHFHEDFLFAPDPWLPYDYYPGWRESPPTVPESKDKGELAKICQNNMPSYVKQESAEHKLQWIQQCVRGFNNNG